MNMPHSGDLLRKDQFDTVLDIFYSADYGRLRLLGELDITREQDTKLERLQAEYTVHPTKVGGFELRTESPDTRRLNDASYSGSILKPSFGFGSK